MSSNERDKENPMEKCGADHNDIFIKGFDVYLGRLKDFFTSLGS